MILRQMADYLKYRRIKPDAQEIILGDVRPNQVPDKMRVIISANVAAMEWYYPGVYPGEVVLFRSREHGLSVHFGWEELTQGGVKVITIPGNHRGILQEPNVSHLTEALRETWTIKSEPDLRLLKSLAQCSRYLGTMVMKK